MRADAHHRTRRTGAVEVALLVTVLVVVGGPLRSRVFARSAAATGPEPAFLAMRTGPDGIRTAVPEGRGASATVVVAIDPGTTAQKWTGVGGALTDAATSLLSSSPEGVDRLFSPPERGGAGLDIVRLPLSATDFSVADWTWSLSPSGDALPPEPALDALAVLDAVMDVRPGLAVLAAPWTSPPGMRTEPGARGGALLDTALDDYARLLIGQAEWLRSHGVPLASMSIGNEPGHVGDYPTLAIDDRQAVTIADHIEGELDRLGVDLIALDHNWSDVDRVETMLATGAFDAVGFHCYDGSTRQVADVGVPHLVTECTATDGDWHSSVGWMARELVGDAVRAGSTGLVMWNLALDPLHGPKAPGGCEECRGLVTIDPATGAVTTAPEFDVLRELSAAADPGASVVPTERIAQLPIAAFVNPDGSVGVFGHNDRPTPVEVEIDVAGYGAVTVAVDGWSVFSVRTPVS